MLLAHIATTCALERPVFFVFFAGGVQALPTAYVREFVAGVAKLNASLAVM